MSSVATLQPEPAPIVACTISRDVQNFDLLIDDMELELGESWGDLSFDDAPLFLTQPEAATLEFVAIAVDGEDESDLSRIIDIIKAARERGITVVNTPGRNASAVAEFTIGAILAETRKITQGHDALRRGEWRGDLYRADLTGQELSEMTVGLIGYGEVGRRVVKLLKAFGCRILVSDPYVQLSADDLRDGVIQCSLDRILAEADVVSLHPRVTAETTKMINRETLGQMKDGAYLINTARGPLVNYDDLYEALVARKLKGAMLETFDVEPVPPDNRFLKLDNVTLTPHIAGASVKTVSYAAGLAAEEVRRYLSGEPALNRC